MHQKWKLKQSIPIQIQQYSTLKNLISRHSEQVQQLLQYSSCDNLKQLNVITWMWEPDSRVMMSFYVTWFWHLSGEIRRCTDDSMSLGRDFNQTTPKNNAGVNHDVTAVSLLSHNFQLVSHHYYWYDNMKIHQFAVVYDSTITTENVLKINCFGTSRNKHKYADYIMIL